MKFGGKLPISNKRVWLKAGKVTILKSTYGQIYESLDYKAETFPVSL